MSIGLTGLAANRPHHPGLPIPVSSVEQLALTPRLKGWPGLVPDNAGRRQRPAPQRPRKPAVPGFPGQRIRRDDEYRALGVSQAVPAHSPRDQPYPDAATASTQDQHVIRTAGHADQDPACRTPLHPRLHHRIVRDFPPHRG